MRGGFDNLLSLTSAHHVSDISTLDWEDVALPVSGRGRKARMVESSFVIHSSLSSQDRDISIPEIAFRWRLCSGVCSFVQTKLLGNSPKVYCKVYGAGTVDRCE